MMSIHRFLFILLISFSGIAAAYSQPLPAPVPDTSKLEILPGSGRYTFEKLDSLNTIVTLVARARVKQGNTLIEADSAIVNLYTKVMEAFGNVHINDSDTMNTYSQYVKYLGKERTAVLRTNVHLNDSKGGQLSTSELLYDLSSHIGSYNKGGTIVNKQTTLTSKEATYYGESKDIIFKKDVILIDPEYRLASDSLLYNSTTEIARFVSPTTIITKDKRKIYTRDGFYNLRTGEAFFGQRATIIDSTSTVTADSMAFDDKNGLAQLRGRAVYNDSSISVLANVMNIDRKNSTFFATGKPLMIIRQNKDSIFITGDTLYSGKLTDRMKLKNVPVITDSNKTKTVFDLLGKDSAQNRFFEAFHHVRIYNDSIQAVCDSLFYASTDSAFRLYQRPVVWASNSQITADTIYLFTRHQKPEHLYAFENGFIVNQVNKSYYNQVRGRTINGWFKDGAIDYVRTKGNAESVYYATDDSSKFIGVNKATADAIDMYFKDKAANRVVFRKDLKGTTYPIRQVPPGELELRGFKWQESLRPKSRFELFSF